MIGRDDGGARENGPCLAPADHPEVRFIHLRQILGVLLLFSAAFAVFCVVAFFYTADLALGLSGGVILAFFAAAAVARRQLQRGNDQQAVVLVCAAIICASLASVPLQPALLPTLVVTSLVAAAIAIPYAAERAFKTIMVASWVSVVAVVVAGPAIATTFSGRDISLTDFLFGASTLSAAAAIVVLLLWQFRVRLMAALQQARHTEERARYEATHDRLTGLPNRALLEELLSVDLVGASDEPASFAVLFLDLDGFKNVNDALGHHVGDEFLEVISQRLSACVRPGSGDMVARLGGDEFVVALGLVQRSGRAARTQSARPGEIAGVVVWRIQEALKEPVKLHGHELYATASIGVVPDCQGYESPEEILRDADTAMFEAKRAGAGRSVVFKPWMHTRSVSALRAETDLRRALEREEFTIRYQPIVWLASGGVMGFEAVACWDHSERGPLLPEEFAPLAPQTSSGLTRDLDLFTLGSACRQAASWRQSFPDHLPPKVRVRISADTWREDDLPEKVANTLEKTGLPAYAVMLEVPERAVAGEPESVIQALERLKALGVMLLLGGFGTGERSLTLLHRLPVDVLQIDRSAVRGIRSESEDPVEFMRTVLTLAHGLGLEVLAEGVDGPEQLRTLAELGSDYAQGAHFSQPVDDRGARAILGAEPSW